MLEGHLRYYVQPIVTSLAQLLMQHCTPIMITFMGLAWGVIAGIAIIWHQTGIALAALWLSGLCDMLDGTLARLTNNTQKMGALMDLLSDRTVECVIILGFALLYPQNSLAYILFLIGVLLHFSTFVLVSTFFENTGQKAIYYDFNLVERTEAFITFSCMLLLPAYAYKLLMLLNMMIMIDVLRRIKCIIMVR